MTSHETQAVQQPEHSSESEPSVLSMDSLEAWRESEEARRNSLLGMHDHDPLELKKEFDESIDTSLDDYLNQHGLTTDVENYDEIRSLYRNASVDKISDTEWYTSPSSRGELFYDHDADVPAREVFAQQISDMSSTKNSPETNEEVESAHAEALHMNERFDALSEQNIKVNTSGDVETYSKDGKTYAKMEHTKETELTVARNQLAKLAAKRQGKIFGNGGEAYHDAKQEYDAKVIELGKIQFSDSREMFDQMTEEEKTKFSANVTGYLVDEQSKLRELTTEKLKGTRVGKFVDWMQSGSKKKRIGKSLLIGAGGAAVGAGASFILAGAGLVAGAGAVAVGVSRFGSFARGYASRDKRGMGELHDQHKKELQDHLKNENHDLLDKTHTRTDKWYETDSREQQRQRRRAVGKALAIMGVGAMAGEGIHLIADHVDIHNPFPRGGSRDHSPSPKDLQYYADNHTGDASTPGYNDGSHSGAPFTHDGGSGVDHHLHAEKALPWTEPGSGATSHDVTSYFSGHGGTTEFSTGGVHNFEHWMNGSNGAGYTVKPGDTIWGLSQKYLEAQGVKHPSVYQTDAVKDQMLKAFQAKGFADHRGWLTAGAKVKF